MRWGNEAKIWDCERSVAYELGQAREVEHARLYLIFVMCGWES